MKPARTQKVTILLSEEEKTLLSNLALSEQPALSVAMYLRQTIRSKHRELMRRKKAVTSAFKKAKGERAKAHGL